MSRELSPEHGGQCLGDEGGKGGAESASVQISDKGDVEAAGSHSILYAVATAPAFRHHGYMAALLRYTFSWCREKGIPFCSLIPVDEAIYTSFGFETVCPFDAKRRGDQAPADFDLYTMESAEKVQTERLYSSPDDLPDNPVIMAKITDQGSFCKIFGSALSDEKEEQLSLSLSSRATRIRTWK